MTMWDMAMTIRDYAQGKDVTFARLPIGWPGEALRVRRPVVVYG